MRISPLEKQLHGYRLTTVEITYRLPDFPRLLQNYIWQEYDIHPQFPVLRDFLTFWQKELDGPIHSVTMVSTTLIQPAQFRIADTLLTIQ